jgi:hypothetical protein
VGFTVTASSGDDVNTGRSADPGQRGGVSTLRARGGVDHGAEPGLTQQRGFLPAGVLVVELVAGQQRGDLQQVLVVVRPAEAPSIDVTEHRCHRSGSALRR